MTHTRFASVAVLALVAITIPRPAAADVRLTGFGGVSFINDENKGTYGAAIAFGGLFGFEFEAARTSLGDVAEIDFANIDVDAHMTTYMFNAVVRLPAGPIQPYASAGVGAVRVTGSVGVPLSAASTPMPRTSDGTSAAGSTSCRCRSSPSAATCAASRPANCSWTTSPTSTAAPAGLRLLARHGRRDVQVLRAGTGDQGPGIGGEDNTRRSVPVTRCQ